MNSPSDPLFEKLSSYLDQELPQNERLAFEKELAHNPEAQKLLSELETINGLGEVIHEQMPGEAYFQDLPSRVLHRIQVEEEAEARPVVEPEKAGFWSRLFSPANTWRWATATATMGAVGIGAWVATQIDTGDTLATAPASFNEVAQQQTLENPNDVFVARVAETLGGYGNLGSTLDQGVPVREVVEPSNESLVQTVSFQDLSVPQEAMTELPKQGATAEQCFGVARYCETNGAPSLASNGYRLVFESTDAQQDLHFAAHLGYIRTMWRERLQKYPNHTSESYNKLISAAKVGYHQHSSGAHQDCARAWAITVTAEQLGQKVFTGDALNRLHANGIELKRCAKAMSGR